jgi:hypothetical protein
MVQGSIEKEPRNIPPRNPKVPIVTIVAILVTFGLRGRPEQQYNAMLKEEFKNLFQACMQNINPKPKAKSAEDKDSSLDPNLFEKMSLLNAEGKYHIPSLKLVLRDMKTLTYFVYSLLNIFRVMTMITTMIMGKLQHIIYIVITILGSTLKATPAQFTFGRDMFLPLNFKVEWTFIEQNCQKKLSRNNRRYFFPIMHHDYNIHGIFKLCTGRCTPIVDWNTSFQNIWL